MWNRSAPSGYSVAAVAAGAVAATMGLAVEVAVGGPELPGRSTSAFGSSSDQLKSLGWDNDRSSPHSSFVSGSPSGMNRASVLAMVAPGVTVGAGLIGQIGGKGERRGQVLGVRFLLTGGVPFHAVSWRTVGLGWGIGKGCKPDPAGECGDKQ